MVVLGCLLCGLMSVICWLRLRLDCVSVMCVVVYVLICLMLKLCVLFFNSILINCLIMSIIDVEVFYCVLFD